MKRLVLSLSAAWMLSISTAGAQEPVTVVTPVPAQPAAPEAAEKAANTDLWRYQQAQRDANDPYLAVRSNASYKARMRRERMETRKQYGYSLDGQGRVISVPRRTAAE